MQLEHLRVVLKLQQEQLQLIKQSTSAVISKQNPNGSWIYGEAKVQDWIDSFHTGFNLECIYQIATITNDEVYMNSFNKGVDFYLKVLNVTFKTDYIYYCGLFDFNKTI